MTPTNLFYKDKTIIGMGIIATLIALIISFFMNPQRLKVLEINNSIIQALILTFIMSFGYFIVLKMSREKKILKKELEDYKIELVEYKKKILKERKVENELKKDLEITRNELEKALRELNLKGTVLSKFKHALQQYEHKIESVEESKSLYEMYITWNKEIKNFFMMFLVSPQIYVEEKANVITLKTFKQGDMTRGKSSRMITSIMKENIRNEIMFLLKYDLINIREAKKEENCDYILILTEKGNKLRNSLTHLPLPKE